MLTTGRIGSAGKFARHRWAAAQVLPLPDMATAAPSTGADGSVFVAARGSAGVRRLMPVPFAVQARAHRSPLH